MRGLSDYIRIEENAFCTYEEKDVKDQTSIEEFDFENDDSKEPLTLIIDASGLTISKKGDVREKSLSNYI